MSVAANLARINQVLADRPVKLVAVTKHAAISQIEEAFELGVTEFGENRIQDALKRRENLSPSLVQECNWHFIGHLQTNKVRHAVGNFALIHSVDSLRLAEEISRVAQKKDLVQAVLLQVKAVDDPSKGGFTPQELSGCFAEILALPGLRVEGLMTIAPLTDDRELRMQAFCGVESLREKLSREHNIPLRELSMGMTNDWQQAISQGATMVRLGRAIFERP